MNNRPILFVKTICKNELGKENQNLYDSRRVHKSRVMHRLDDIMALKYLNRNPKINVILENNSFIGEFSSFDKYFIYLKQKYEIVKINIDLIKDIQITSYYTSKPSY
jgi:hypothetical protein